MLAWTITGVRFTMLNMYGCKIRINANKSDFHVRDPPPLRDTSTQYSLYLYSWFRFVGCFMYKTTYCPKPYVHKTTYLTIIVSKISIA